MSNCNFTTVKNHNAAEGAGRVREGLGRGALGLLEGRGRRAGDMSAGSSCSQTPSRAIPTRRVALGDGVQLPPGDYSTTPGGTLFSTTPGGRRWPGSRATSGGWRIRRDPESHVRRGGRHSRGSVAGQNGRGASGKQKGHRLGCSPSGCGGAWSGTRLQTACIISLFLGDTAECPEHTDRHSARTTMCLRATSVGVRAVWGGTRSGKEAGLEIKFS